MIEQSYQRFLDAFETHLKSYPFLMGERPGASDFGVYGQLTQLAHFDPTPAAITLKHAPRVYAWVSLVDDLSGLAPRADQWFARDGLPATLSALLMEAGRTYVPLMLANARALMARSKRVQTTIDGSAWVQDPFPYQAKCLKWLRDEFATLVPQEQAAVTRVLEQAGCAALIHERL